MPEHNTESRIGHEEIHLIREYLLHNKASQHGADHRFQEIPQKDDQSGLLAENAKCICGSRIPASVFANIDAVHSSVYICGL